MTRRVLVRADVRLRFPRRCERARRAVSRRTRSRISAAVLVMLCIVLPAPLVAQSTAEIARQARNAVVTLSVLDSAGRKLGQGSGFILPDGRIVTNAHVVANASRVDIHGLDERYLGTLPYASALSEAIDIA